MKKYLIVILILLVIGFGIYYYLDTVNSPTSPLTSSQKQEQLKKLLGRKAIISVTQSPTGSTFYDGKYFSITYPAAAKIYSYVDPAEQADSNSLETFSFDLFDPRVVLSAQVTGNNSHVTSIDDISGARLRINRSGDYKRGQITIDKVSGLVFTSNGQNAEKTAFFLHNDKVYSFAVTGNDFEGVTKVFDTVVKTVKWK